ncbi:MAG: hypothetical protein ACLFV0_05605 [Nitriliruptoraceae bacterium]
MRATGSDPTSPPPAAPADDAGDAGAARDEHRPHPGVDRGRRVGWLAIWALSVGVFLTWLPGLDAGLGDNHEGRILARHALNVANAQEDGLRASGWLSDWSPYVGDGGEQTSYAHHPPLLNLVYYAAGQLSPLPLDTTMRLTSYLLGVLMLPAGAAVLLRRGVPWPATLLATTAVAITPLFWVYGRLHGNVTLLLVMVLLLVRAAEDRPIPSSEVALTAVVSLVAIVAGYLGMAMAAVLGLWLLWRRGVDRVVIVIGVAMVLGALLSLGYVIGSTGTDRLGEQLARRTSGGGFSTAEFLAQLDRWASALLPGWWRWLLLPAALVAGTLDRRTRPLTLSSALVATAYIVGLPNGSFIHDYWILPILLPAWFGSAALAAALLGRADRAERPTAAAVVAVAGVVILLAAGITHGRQAAIADTYLRMPQAAGTLVRDVGPAADQTVAWRTRGIAAPRWLSLYWDLPPGELTAEELAAVPAEELILVRRSSAPEWLGEEDALLDAAVAVRGDYAVVTGAEVRQLAAGPRSTSAKRAAAPSPTTSGRPSKVRTAWSRNRWSAASQVCPAR